jgi:hypothetical protein
MGTCFCQDSFTGSHCETLIQSDPCASNPCQTRGYCALSALNKTYTCVCQDNFIGKHCERSNRKKEDLLILILNI